MSYKKFEDTHRPVVRGWRYWFWRLMRTRIEEMSWVLRRIVKVNHITSGYYGPPNYWEQNASRVEEVVSNIRGQDYKPAIFVHGIMPRCGSNLVHDIVECHPEIIGREIGVTEFPVLCNCRSMDAFYASMIARHRQLSEHISGIEAMAFFTAGWMKDIQTRCGVDMTAVLKMPSVQHLQFFDTSFPRDKIVIVIRDGRDILQSTEDTWGNNRSWTKSKSAISREFASATKEIVTYIAKSKDSGKQNLHVFRYEDYVENPERAARELYSDLNLTVDATVVAKAASLPLVGSSSFLKNGTPTWDPVKKPHNFHSTQKWHKWSKRRRSAFASIANEALIDLGYEQNENWVMPGNSTGLSDDGS